MAEYEVVGVARVPASSGPPDLVELERIPAEGLSWERELNRPGTINVGVQVDAVPEPIRLRLRELSERPLEVWVRRDGAMVAAGPVTGWQIQQSTVTLTVPGLLAYLRYVLVASDLTFSGVDQHFIVRDLIDQWQTLPFGHYGLDTSAITASGVTRDRPYLRDEHHEVYRAVELLTAVRDGFDVDVDPESREVRLWHPEQGSDLSASVHLDRRNIGSVQVQASAAPQDVASEGFAVGTGEDPVSSVASNTGVRATFGRAAVAESFDGVSQQSTIDEYAAELLESRGRMMLVPGPDLIPVGGADVGDFDKGDRVEYSFDAGLGLITGVYRTAKLRTSVDDVGREAMAVEFI